MYTLNITKDQAMALQALIVNHKHKCLDYAAMAARQGNEVLHDLHYESYQSLNELQDMVDEILVEYC